MSRRMKCTWVWACIVLGILSAMQAAGPVEELSVSVDQGSLEIIATPGTNLAVAAFRVKDGKATREMLAASDAKLRRENGVLVLKLSSRGRSGLVFQVHVPPKTPLDLKASHGGITVTNHDGSVKAKSSVGKIQLGRIRGEVEAQTSNGDLWLESGESSVRIKTSGGKMEIGEIRGPAVLESSGGSIQLVQAHGELIAKAGGGSINVLRARDSVRAQASGGSISVNFMAQPRNECVIKSSGGPVLLGLWPQLNLRLAARGEGEVTTDLPIEWKDVHERYERGLLNTNGGTITARAEGNKVNILAFSERAAPVKAMFKVKSLIGLVGDSLPMNLVLPPPMPFARRESKMAAKDVPRIERDEKIWQHAEWKPVILLPTGVRLRDGRWIDAEITALSDFQVGYRKPDGVVESAKLNQVTAIVLHPVPDTFKDRLEGSREGVVLRKGDFFEGEFSRLDMTEATLSSVLFGLKRFNLKTEVGALVMPTR
jgi:hypothetical protein